MPRDVVVLARLDRSLKGTVERTAARLGVSVSSYIEGALREALKRDAGRAVEADDAYRDEVERLVKLAHEQMS